MLVDVYKTDGTVSGQVELNDGVFSVEPNHHVLYLASKVYLANQRQGTHKSKERGEIRGGGKKPWRQKGRGGARAGTTRSPLWVGGGRIFGPKPRDYRLKVPRKVAMLAKRSALSLKNSEERLVVVENFTYEAPRTKDFVSLLQALKLDGKKVLVLTSEHNENVYKSGRNIERVKVLSVNSVSTYDILNSQVLLLQSGAVEYFNNTYSKEKAAAE
ncbi:MAG: 50S ribosomal protein L4 [Ignavibacteria bacterium]|nr:50S ribosomal protein L4 [Ignavibacteria bacterium]MCA0389195.1 50S ribosomal protein L4 [Bacteroidota bacterium]